LSVETGFTPRPALTDRELADLAWWSEQEFLKQTEGSAIRRIGYECWLRNIAVGLGNAQTREAIVAALRHLCSNPSDLVREHAQWGLRQHGV
jgi:epoxyqueuosine reductase